MASLVKGIFRQSAAALAGSSVLAFALPLGAQTPPAETALTAPSAADAIPEAPMPGLGRLETTMAAHTYTILGDTDHRHMPEIYGFVGKPGFLDAFRRAGGKEIAIEMPAELQTLADNLAEKSKTASSPAEDRANIADFAKQVSDAGMMFLFPDDEGGAKSLRAMGAIVVGAARRCINVTFADDGEGFTAKAAERSAKKLVGEYAKETKIKDFSDAANAMMQDEKFIDRHEKEFDRLAMDAVAFRGTPEGNKPVVARAIVDNRANGGGKGLILYGAMHAEALQTDLKQKGQSSSIIYLHASRPAFEDNKEIYGLRLRDKPGVANFVIAEGDFTAPPVARRNFFKALIP